MSQKPLIDYRFCQKQDVKTVCKLLQSNNLPYEDFTLEKINLILATHNGEIIGSIGAELYQPHALLRSFVIVPEFQGIGIGNTLLQYLMSYCCRQGVRQVHLLTDTADGYFRSKGFTVTNRNEAPDEIQQTTEFKELCPSTCAYLVKNNLQLDPGIYPVSLQQWQTDDDTGAMYWAIPGNNLSFTFFEVPAHRTFPEHHHLSEQITHVLQGTLFFEVEGETSSIGPGDTIIIPSNTRHKVWTNAEAVKAVDAWAPINKKYSKDN